MVNSDLYDNNSVFAPDVGDFSWQEPEPDEGQIQDEADQEIVDGLSSGQLTIPEEGMQRLANNRNARVQIQLSQGLTPEQKQDAISQSFAADTEIRRAAMPAPPEQVAQSPDAQKQKLIQQLPPEAQGKPWQFNPKEGNLQMPRGYKEPDAAGVVSQPEQTGNAISPEQLAPDDDPVMKKHLPPQEYVWAKKHNLFHAYDWVTDPKTGRGKFEINKTKFAASEKLYDREHPKPEKADPHDLSKLINQYELDEKIRTNLIKRKTALRNPTDPAPVAEPTQAEIDAVKKQYGLIPPATQPGSSAGQAKVSAAIQAAKGGDKAAQNALDKRGIQWQQ